MCVILQEFRHPPKRQTGKKMTFDEMQDFKIDGNFKSTRVQVTPITEAAKNFFAAWIARDSVSACLTKSGAMEMLEAFECWIAIQSKNC